ncbi:MAG: twin-arginine translocase TatA/TatE family subunit [Polyangiales bacterium]
MFNIGFGELAIICIVLIIAVGPERLPSMMKTLGKTIRTLRQASRDIRASTGIDELLREDFDLYTPPPAPRRPAPIPTPAPALPANADVPTEPAKPADAQTPTAPPDAAAAIAAKLRANPAPVPTPPAPVSTPDAGAMIGGGPEPKPISREDLVEVKPEPVPTSPTPPSDDPKSHGNG